MTKSWGYLINEFTGEPTGSLVCGECSDKHFEWHEVQCVFDSRDIYPDNCCKCHKNAGDYFNRKAA